MQIVITLWPWIYVIHALSLRPLHVALFRDIELTANAQRGATCRHHLKTTQSKQNAHRKIKLFNLNETQFRIPDSPAGVMSTKVRANQRLPIVVRCIRIPCGLAEHRSGTAILSAASERCGRVHIAERAIEEFRQCHPQHACAVRGGIGSNHSGCSRLYDIGSRTRYVAIGHFCCSCVCVCLWRSFGGCGPFSLSCFPRSAQLNAMAISVSFHFAAHILPGN